MSVREGGVMQCQCELLEPRRMLATYYVSPAGNDQSTGLSVAQAWRTPDRANGHRFRPGDVLLFQGGQSYDGHLYLSARDAGTAAKPVVISTFGRGRATLNSGDRTGLEISEGAGVAVTNLRFVGNGMLANDAYGIYVHAGIAAKVLSYLHFRNVEATGYGREGIAIVASGAGSSISDVKIDHSSVHHNRWGGITVTGSSIGGNKNYVIDHVRSYDHPGVKTDSFVTGNGIYLADVEDALVQRCVAFNNGAEGTAPVGIWAAGANRVTFQHNEAYANRTATTTDGGGFDFDWNVTNSVMQYNYAHDNDGPGYMLGGGPTSNSGNVVRYNVSENDARKNGKGAIYLWGNVASAEIHNNVVYLSAASSASTAAVQASDVGASGKVPQNVRLRNNIFQTTGGARLIHLTSNVAAKSSLTFAGNAYYSGADPFRIQWGATTYSNLIAWRDATGQERVAGRNVGYQGHPRLQGAGLGGTIGDADRLGELSAYRLQKKSSLADRGQSLPTTTAADFFGGLTPLGIAPDIGAHELR